jgi:hypothetical protein
LDFHVYNPVISGKKNVLSVFILDPIYFGTLASVTMNKDGKEIRSIPLKKIRRNFYVTDPVSFDDGPFEISILSTGATEQDNGKMRLDCRLMIKSLNCSSSQCHLGFWIQFFDTEGK